MAATGVSEVLLCTFRRAKACWRHCLFCAEMPIVMHTFLIGLLLVLLGTMSAFSAQAQRLRIVVETDRGVEVVNALMVQLSSELLADSAADPQAWGTTRWMRISYAHFASFRGHAAVRRTQWLSDKIGTGVYLLPLFYQGFPHPRRHTPVSAPLLAAVHPNADSAARLVDAYMQLVGQFDRDAGFVHFMRRHRRVYARARAEVRFNLPPATFVPAMEAYYGTRHAAYRLLVNPFFKSQWGMAWQVERTRGTVATQIAAPFQSQTPGRGRRLRAGFDDADAVRNLSVHEFGHTFVNPLTSRPAFLAALAAYQGLFRPIPGQPQYRDWETVFTEHLVRAGEVRLAHALGRPEVSKQLRVAYADWMYLPFFEAQLQRYEADRQRYPSLEAFLPVVLAALSALPQ